MSAVDELEPAPNRFELGVELQHVSRRLMSIASEHIVSRRHGIAGELISDSMTLDKLAERLDAGTLSVELAQLFVVAATTLIGRREAELDEAAR